MGGGGIAVLSDPVREDLFTVSLTPILSHLDCEIKRVGLGSWYERGLDLTLASRPP
jgi:hypothetical protein